MRATGASVPGKTHHVRSTNGAYLKVRINGRRYWALLDTGSEASLVPPVVTEGMILEEARQELRAANDSEITVLGTANLSMRVGDASFPLEGMVVDNVSEVLLGLTWLNEFSESWDFQSGYTVLGGRRHKLYGPPMELESRKVEVATTTTVPAGSDVDLIVRDVKLSPAGLIACDVFTGVRTTVESTARGEGGTVLALAVTSGWL